MKLHPGHRQPQHADAALFGWSQAYQYAARAIRDLDAVAVPKPKPARLRPGKGVRATEQEDRILIHAAVSGRISHKDGTVTVDLTSPDDGYSYWFLITASNSQGESSLGRDSSGTLRDQRWIGTRYGANGRWQWRGGRGRHAWREATSRSRTGVAKGGEPRKTVRTPRSSCRAAEARAWSSPPP